MKVRKPLYPYFYFLLLLSACSSQSTSLTSKAFHNTTAHYNGYFYAKDEIEKIEKTILRSEVDDYNRILRLFPALDSAQAKGYDKEIQEAIKMASLAIQRHPNSKWVDDSYILVGKSRLYSLDWGNAIQTFKYVNTKSKDPDSRHEAIIQLARTFIEYKEFGNAESAFDYLGKENLNKTNLKNLLLQKAYYYQLREDYDKMVGNLTEAVPLLTRKDRPGRIYFIMGQVFQKLGFESEAFNYYKKCLTTNPEYEVDFYARLYMAQVAEISKSRDLASARKSFKKLLKDSKNRDFRDKIYFELGVFEQKQKNLKEAIANYNFAIKQGSNKIIDGQAYLMLGEIYYDTLKDFKLSQAYYDSAVSALPPTYENYKAIQARQKILNEFVTNLNTIAWQDSLLVMAKMDTASLRKHIASVLESKKKPEVKSKRKKKERIDIEAVNSSLSTPSSLESSNWYFGNASAVGLGQAEFARVWGTIPLEDNWRRSSKTSLASRNALVNASSKNKSQSTEIPVVAAIAKNPVQEEYDKIMKQLPLTEQQVGEANKKIEDAYFRLGDIYYFDLQEKDNAVASYETLLSRFPSTQHRAEALYKLYLIYKDTYPEKATMLANNLKSEFPNSPFAKTLVNPNYLKESGLTQDKQKEIYKYAYEKFLAEDFTGANDLVDHAISLEKTAFSPNLELLKTLLIGKTQDITHYQLSLDQFIKNNPEGELANYAKMLLESSRDFTLKREKEKGIQYIKSFEEPHYFILVSSAEDKIETLNSKTLDTFNSTYFKDLGLKVSNLILNENYVVTLVADLPRLSSGLEYFKTFTEKLPTLTELKNHKFNTFIITKDNFDIFYRTKGLDEYIRFFEKNYHPENP